jgi:hypothetical protein
MGRKFKCDSSSNSSCDPCSSSSSAFVYCCKKYPKCKCAPIYYPNNCNPYPCNPCAPKYCPPNPCAPFLPCPPYPCPPQNCSPYTSALTTITQSSTTVPLTSNSPNVNVYNVSPSLTGLALTLPAINTLTTCNYNKMFVLSNLSGGSTITLNTTSGDVFTNNNSTTFNLTAGSTVTIYAVYTGGTNYWAVQT